MKKLLILASFIFISNPAFALEDLGAKYNSKANFSSIKKQQEGDYPELLRQNSPGGAIQDAWSKAPLTAGVLNVEWKKDLTVKVRLREGMTTAIVLPDFEEIEMASLGDQVNFKVNLVGKNKALIYTQASGYDTNLLFIGKTSRVYAFYLRSESWNSKNITDQVVYLSGTMPTFFQAEPTEEDKAAIAIDKTVKDLTKDGVPEWLRAINFDPMKIRHDRKMEGNKDIAPILVFRDDNFTYLDYGDNHDARYFPAPFRVVDNVDQPVNKRISPDGRYLVIETIDNITLVHGDKVVCIKSVK
ncbi:MAG: TrbG/VirB9 family P-type conjugative transfer protein [Bacilli bacterium]